MSKSEDGVGFASALRAPVEPRSQLRHLIVGALKAAEMRCRHGYGPGPVGTLDACGQCVADVLTEVFPDVEREEVYVESFSGEETPAVDAGGMSHARLVLRAAPIAEGTAGGDD